MVTRSLNEPILSANHFKTAALNLSFNHRHSNFVMLVIQIGRFAVGRVGCTVDDHKSPARTKRAEKSFEDGPWMCDLMIRVRNKHGISSRIGQMWIVLFSVDKRDIAHAMRECFNPLKQEGQPANILSQNLTALSDDG